MQIQRDIPLAPKTWFKTGGAARYYCEPLTAEEYPEALKFAENEGLDIFVLGEGANILISDDGFPGLVIRPENTGIEIEGEETSNTLIRAGAGASMEAVINFCLEHNLAGLEEFSGIPGTIGGAVYINLHYFDHLLSDFLVKGTVINRETGEIEEVSADWFQLGYDTSRLHRKDYYLLDATFAVTRVSDAETAYASGRRDETIRHRNRRYPESHTCGSFFRNFQEDEVTITSNGTLMIFVAYYLDKLGIKGELSVGDAAVSFQHANMIVNRGEATSADIASLARTMQSLVKERFDIVPQPECQLIGFQDYPLLS